MPSAEDEVILMATDPLVLELLEEVLDGDRTPEEVCSNHPELLPEVRKRWRQMRAVEAELDGLFPTSGDAKEVESGAAWPDRVLPQVPGYDVEAVLGRGGMGVVYKARHLRLNRRVALKMLLAGAYATPHERARFQREAEAVAGLQHPNIVQVYDVADHEGRPYFTMELVEGGSLAQKLAGTPQPAGQAAALAATLAQAVQAAHQNGVVHRDLKPANVLLSADGTSKISDFGLARRLEGGGGLTQTGAALGTPSYMAPEQASGKAGAIGPAADVYALGAILYELLTGRPPFRAETGAETLLQVVYEEPVPPSRLNAKVPRDLETICLKCLHKDPGRRYATAAALAEDLQRFERGDAIAARPAGILERTSKWMRRHPTTSTLLAASLLLTIMLVGGCFWVVIQQAHTRNAAEVDLKEVTRLQESARWAEAQAALERAEARLGDLAPDDLRPRMSQARADLDLVIKLDNIRLKRATRGELSFYKAQADRRYQETFREAGLGTARDNAARVAARVTASAIRGALVAALDDWTVCVSDQQERAWLSEVARQVDPDLDGWRERILDPALWDDRAALSDLAERAPARQSVSLLLALGERLRLAGGDAIPFLKRIQKEHPADFWANLILGNALLQVAPQDAAGYYRAALAGRPTAAVGYCAVGDALRLQNALAEATEYYHKALHIDPGYARAHSNLGLVFQVQGRLDEAIASCRTALQFDGDYAWAHHNLANTLRISGQLEEAHDHFQEVLKLDPKNVEVQSGLRSVLVQLGRGPEARVAWRKALDANPAEAEAWFGYAELCLFLGEQEEYRRARRDLLDRFGATDSPWVAEPVGRACLFLVGTEQETQRATALIGRALAAKAATPEWVHRYLLFAKGLADYRQGPLASATSAMEGEASRVMGPCPRLILAMAQHRQGQRKQARRTLAQAVVTFDWSAAQADSRDVWICHILRREAEALILPELHAFAAEARSTLGAELPPRKHGTHARGKYQPVDNDERLALAAICRFRGQNHAAARLYAEAFATDPALVDQLVSACLCQATLGDKQPVGRIEELTATCRYPDARCAALAGSGLGMDGAAVGAGERTRWRKQARDWLVADLAVWTKALDGNSQAARDRVRKMLTYWQADPELAGLRDASALERLSSDERKECLALWQQVSTVLRRAQMAR